MQKVLHYFYYYYNTIFYVFFSLNGPERRKYLKGHLSTYYSTLCNVLAGKELFPSFNLEDLQKEYKDKNMFGLLSVLIDLPAQIMSSEDVPDYGTSEVDEIQRCFSALENNPLLRPRYFDALVDTSQFIHIEN